MIAAVVAVATGLLAQAETPSALDLLPKYPACGAIYGPRLSDQVLKLPVVGSEGEAELGQSMVSSVKADVHEAGLSLSAPVIVPGRAMFTNYTLTISAGPLRAGERGGRRVWIPTSVDLKWASERRSRETDPVVALWVSDANPAELSGNVDLSFTNQNFARRGSV